MGIYSHTPGGIYLYTCTYIEGRSVQQGMAGGREGGEWHRLYGYKGGRCQQRKAYVCYQENTGISRGKSCIMPKKGFNTQGASII